MDEFGLNCTVLRWLERCEDHNLVVMEWHPGSPTPEIDVEWVDDPDKADIEKELVTEAYLGAFSHLATAEQLSKEFELTERLSLLYQALRCLEISREQKPDSPWGENCFNRAARYMGDAMTGVNGSKT